MAGSNALAACPCCGLVQTLPEVPARHCAVCPRCYTPVRSPGGRGPSNQRTAAVALAALIVYVPAILLPILRVEKLGHFYEDSLLSGVITLLSSGNLLVGTVVLLFSIVLPPVKLAALFVLALGGPGLSHHHRAFTYHAVEFLGRWGMLDVMLVAILVAFVKLGDLIEITPGPGLIAFAVCVTLSLVASLCFDPHCLWEEGV